MIIDNGGGNAIFWGYFVCGICANPSHMCRQGY
jgi:hypothetical protein